MYKPRKSKAKFSVMKTIVVCKINTAIIPENNSKKKKKRELILILIVIVVGLKNNAGYRFAFCGVAGGT